MSIVIPITLATVLLNVMIQVAMVVLTIQYVRRRVLQAKGSLTTVYAAWLLALATTGLFVGHMLQIALWATIFLWCGAFPDFHLAFYHSAVNFASLGYGDMVMESPWRLLGALEATNGVLMSGVSTGLIFWLISQAFQVVSEPS
jgi:voltage-gated potassium channel Kch